MGGGGGKLSIGLVAGQINGQGKGIEERGKTGRDKWTGVDGAETE